MASHNGIEALGGVWEHVRSVDDLLDEYDSIVSHTSPVGSQ